MSDENTPSQPPEATASTPASAAPAAAAPDPAKRQQAERVLAELLRLMEIPARLELKDAADGGISAAVFLEGEIPGLVNLKRTHLVDALQFLANKIVNRPQGEKRWIAVGIGGHPEPRPPRTERQPGGAPQAQGQAHPQGQATRAPKPPREPREPRSPQQAAPAASAAPKAHAPKGAHEAEELKLDVAEDPAVAAAARLLAEKSAKHGRFYALSPMKPDDRARVLKAVGGVAGVKASVEGEGRARRVVFTPDKPVPMPKKGVMPDYDEDEA